MHEMDILYCGFPHKVHQVPSNAELSREQCEHRVSSWTPLLDGRLRRSPTDLSPPTRPGDSSSVSVLAPIRKGTGVEARSSALITFETMTIASEGTPLRIAGDQS